MFLIIEKKFLILEISMIALILYLQFVKRIIFEESISMTQSNFEQGKLEFEIVKWIFIIKQDQIKIRKNPP